MLVSVVGVVLAIVIVGVIVAIDRTRPAAPGPGPRHPLPAWSSFGFGLVSLVALAWPLLLSRTAPSGDEGAVTASNSQLLPMASISFSLVALALGVYALKRGDRHWSVWVGLVAGGVTVAFWLFFLIGNIVSPA